MVTAKTQYNLKNAREYFEEHLCVGDYYDEGQRVAGEWVGSGAERLGLSGKVRADAFLRLCENQHPGTGDKLTLRLNTTRTKDDETAANRRNFLTSLSHRRNQFPSRASSAVTNAFLKRMHEQCKRP